MSIKKRLVVTEIEKKQTQELSVHIASTRLFSSLDIYFIRNKERDERRVLCPFLFVGGN